MLYNNLSLDCVHFRPSLRYNDFSFRFGGCDVYMYMYMYATCTCTLHVHVHVHVHVHMFLVTNYYYVNKIFNIFCKIKL